MPLSLDWNRMTYSFKLSLLAGASAVPGGLLEENETLVTMIKRGDSQEDCLAFINENW
jgi:ADP-ribose pyrophosphatase YjhB (NUDIX family)